MCVATKIYSIITVLLRKAGNIKWTMNSPNHIGDVHEANRESTTSQKLSFLESWGSTFILRSESCHFVIQECNPQNQIKSYQADVLGTKHVCAVSQSNWQRMRRWVWSLISEMWVWFQNRCRRDRKKLCSLYSLKYCLQKGHIKTSWNIFFLGASCNCFVVLCIVQDGFLVFLVFGIFLKIVTMISCRACPTAITSSKSVFKSVNLNISPAKWTVFLFNFHMSTKNQNFLKYLFQENCFLCSNLRLFLHICIL